MKCLYVHILTRVSEFHFQIGLLLATVNNWFLFFGYLKFQLELKLT